MDLKKIFNIVDQQKDNKSFIFLLFGEKRITAIIYLITLLI